MLKNFFSKSFLGEVSFLLYIGSFFLTLGNDFSGFIQLRMLWGGLILLGLYWGIKNRIFLVDIKSPPLIIFAGFFLFQIIRALYAVSQCGGSCWTAAPPFQQYFKAVSSWFFYLSFFCLSYFFFCSRQRVVNFFKLVFFTTFFCAMNAVPALLIHGPRWSGYFFEKSYSFFYPAFYFHDLIPKYLMSKYFHPNYVGDLLAFGFFSALGLIIYRFQIIAESKREGRSRPGGKNFPAGLYFEMTGALVIASGVLLLFSRGTMLFFFLSLFLFLGGFVLKYPSKKIFLGASILAVLIFIFLGWAGNLQKALNELATLDKESQVMTEGDSYSKGSFSANIEGMKRAKAMSRDYPLLGVGTGGYREFSMRYAESVEIWEKRPLAALFAMNHYVQILAEEGAGAYLYFLFLAAYVFQMVRGMFLTGSRFKFLAALSCFSSVMLVLGHASIIFIMQRFSASMIVYVFMGASLAILRKDFIHQSEK